MELNELIVFLISLTNLAVGIRVFVKDPQHAVNRSFFVFVAGMSIWSASVCLLYVTHDFIFDKFAWAGYYAMFTGMIVFLRLFPSESKVPPRFLLVLIPLILSSFLIPFNGFIERIVIDENGIVHPILGTYFPVFVTITLCYALVASYFFIRNFIHATEKHRMQMAYLATGIVLFIASFIIFDILLPFIGRYEFNLVGPATSLAFVVLTSYAIVRHQLMDIRFAIQRGIIYSILLGLIITLYVALLSSIILLFGTTSDMAIYLSAGLTTIAGIFGAPVLERWFRKLTDSVFFKERYDYADVMHKLSVALSEARNFDEVVSASERTLKEALRARQVTIDFSLEAPAKTSEHIDRHTLHMPIMRDEETVGTLRIGPKLSGDTYTAEDRKLVETFVYQASTALSRAKLYAKTKLHAAQLERTVKRRTRELRESHDRERQMLADISHNLQTPLTIFQTRLDSAKKRLGDDAEMASLEQSLSMFSSFIYELLSLAKLESEENSAERMPLNFSTLVSDLVEETGTIAASRGISVQSQIAPSLMVEGDERRLRETIMNIASNALKYMRTEGERSVLFALREEEGFAMLSIIDTGMGITKRDLPHIFDRFYRGKDTVADTRGTGIGLSIAKRIIEQHGGTISAESSSEGTTISIRLPLPSSE